MSSTSSYQSTNAMVDAFKNIQKGINGLTRSKSLASCNQYDFRPEPDVHIPIYSYSCVEWAFKKHSDVLPVQARGLFVRQVPDVPGSWMIVARGYDKFFNVGEVPTTTWDYIEKNTVGPYEITLKENGCIIFIAAVEGHILVTSKHALGPSKDSNREAPSHADMGERWLDTHLKQSGSTRKELAEFLTEHNITAVFELADDEFEEHILEYPPDRRGLYLHGINQNTPEFITWSVERLSVFAKRFGFFLVEFLIRDTVADIRALAEECGKTGSYKGRPIEGFVVRSQLNTHGLSKTSQQTTYLFKIKYDEPYLMFREWREATMAILHGRADRFTPRHALTGNYMAWVVNKRKEKPHLFAKYTQMKGIIYTRNLFLREQGLKSICGSEILKLANESYVQTEHASLLPSTGTNGSTPISLNGIDSANQKILLVPIATVGIGKTTLARALANMFPIEHVQSDDIKSKKGTASLFLAKVINSFKTKDIVFADRNNHLYQHREKLSISFRGAYPNGKLVALDWGVEKADKNELIRLTTNRINSRGDNHQTLTSKDPKLRGIIHGFVNKRSRFDRSNPADSMFDQVISLNVKNSVARNAELIIQALGWKSPDPSDMVSSVQFALEYKLPANQSLASISSAAQSINNQPKNTLPESTDANLVSLTQNLNISGLPKKKRPRYFAIKIAEDLEPILETLFSDSKLALDGFWSKLVKSGRVNAHRKNGWHVTLGFQNTGDIYNRYLEWWHRTAINGKINGSASLKSEPNSQIDALALDDADKYLFSPMQPVQVCIKKIAWDGMLMAIEVTGTYPEMPCSNKIPHITVATINNSVKHVKSNLMLELANSGSTSLEIHTLTFPTEIVLNGTLEGMF
ncbi:tRNA ligase [Batrachochytrium dendrobatidis]|nr:tRNA ligase [Batrachochytrium dendrobatidis]KAK5667109.1 tRNA ligase [Batrachochytrium dendrobatidis]